MQQLLEQVKFQGHGHKSKSRIFVWRYWGYPLIVGLLGLGTCGRSTSNHLDSPDLPGHGNIGDRHVLELAEDRSFWRQIATAGGMLRLNTSRHDDDEEDDDDAK